MIELRLITQPEDPAIEAFGRLQERAYPEPDHLIPASYLPTMISQDTAYQRNFMIVAQQEDTVVGGTVFHLLPDVNTGFSSFMVVAPELRGQGLARRLHQARFAVLDDEANRRIEGLFIDVLAPQRLTPKQWVQEQAVGSDPVARLRVFDRLGFRKVDIDYEEPLGGPNGGPLTTVDLLYCPRLRLDTVPTPLVVDTMRRYWQSWLGATQGKRLADELERRASGPVLKLVPLTGHLDPIDPSGR